jgi:hypothetical protein
MRLFKIDIFFEFTILSLTSLIDSKKNFENPLRVHFCNSGKRLEINILDFWDWAIDFPLHPKKSLRCREKRMKKKAITMFIVFCYFEVIEFLARKHSYMLILSSNVCKQKDYKQKQNLTVLFFLPSFAFSFDNN